MRAYSGVPRDLPADGPVRSGGRVLHARPVARQRRLRRTLRAAPACRLPKQLDAHRCGCDWRTQFIRSTLASTQVSADGLRAFRRTVIAAIPDLIRINGTATAQVCGSRHWSAAWEAPCADRSSTGGVRGAVGLLGWRSWWWTTLRATRTRFCASCRPTRSCSTRLAREQLGATGNSGGRCEAGEAQS